MARFQIDAYGEKFEIEAPDQATALAAFGQLTGETLAPPRGSGAGSLSAEPSSDYQRQAILNQIRDQLRGPDPAETGYTPSSVPFLDPINAFGTSLAEGVPIAGPFLKDVGNNVDAWLASMLEGRPVSPEERNQITESEQAQFPAASTAGELAGIALPLGGLGSTRLGGALLGFTGKTVPRIAASAASTLGISTADQVARGKDIGEALMGSVVPSAVAAAIPGGEALGRALLGRTGRAIAPTVEELKDEAGTLYDAARGSGVEMSQQGTIALSDDMHRLAVDEGLVSPTGRINTSYPKIAEALRMFDDYSRGTMTVAQMQATRRILQDAAKSLDPGERRLGTMMLSRFDDMVSQGVPQLQVANSIYARAKKGELIDTAIELAGSRAGQFSGSGFENALRTEFRTLERQIIKGQLKGLSQEEIDAISKVARGGPLENIARWLGKFAPTGVVSAGLSGGVPFAIGNAVGGPALGATAAAATMGIGAVGRSAATAMTRRNAELAGELMRRGALPQLSARQQQLIQALTGSAVPVGLLARTFAMDQPE